jgi:transposase
VTRICPRCGTANSLQNDGGVIVCLLCGHRPNGDDPGSGSQAAYQLGTGAGRGAEKHTKGGIAS